MWSFPQSFPLSTHEHLWRRSSPDWLLQPSAVGVPLHGLMLFQMWQTYFPFIFRVGKIVPPPRPSRKLPCWPSRRPSRRPVEVELRILESVICICAYYISKRETYLSKVSRKNETCLVPRLAKLCQCTIILMSTFGCRCE